MHVRKGDKVIVISGNDKGAVGEVQQVFRDRNRVVVEGVNLRWKTSKPTQQDPKGDRSQKECPVHASNVMLYDDESGKGVRKRVVEEV